MALVALRTYGVGSRPVSKHDAVRRSWSPWLTIRAFGFQRENGMRGHVFGQTCLRPQRISSMDCSTRPSSNTT